MPEENDAVVEEAEKRGQPEDDAGSDKPEAEKPKPKDIQQTSAFKKGFKRMKSRGADMELLKPVLFVLQLDGELDEKYRDHQLDGKWKDSRDCHIQPDWVLIYRITEDALILQATGTHSDLFK